MGMCALHSAKRNLGTVQTGIKLSLLVERRDLGGAQRRSARYLPMTGKPEVIETHSQFLVDRQL